MQCWRSNTGDEELAESLTLAEILLIHHRCYGKSLDNSTFLIVKCQSSTLFEISRHYAIKISGLITDKPIEYIKIK